MITSKKDNFSKRPDFIKSLFNKISKDYDKLNNIMSFGLHQRIKKDAIKNIAFFNHSTLNFLNCLDLCTGTGDIAALLKQYYPFSNVVGVDFSEKMLSIAKEKHPDITFLEADISQLPFENESFDLCVISFGLRNVENIEVVLKEIHRVLKPDGIFVNIDLGKPNRLMSLFLKPYMYFWIAFVGKLFHGDKTPYQYLAVSNESFPSQAELVDIYKKIGFKESKNKNYLFGQIASQISRK